MVSLPINRFIICLNQMFLRLGFNWCVVELLDLLSHSVILIYHFTNPGYSSVLKGLRFPNVYACTRHYANSCLEGYAFLQCAAASFGLPMRVFFNTQRFMCECVCVVQPKYLFFLHEDCSVLLLLLTAYFTKPQTKCQNESKNHRSVGFIKCCICTVNIQIVGASVSLNHSHTKQP